MSEDPWKRIPIVFSTNSLEEGSEGEEGRAGVDGRGNGWEWEWERGGEEYGRQKGNRAVSATGETKCVDRKPWTESANERGGRAAGQGLCGAGRADRAQGGAKVACAIRAALVEQCKRALHERPMAGIVK